MGQTPATGRGRGGRRTVTAARRATEPAPDGRSPPGAAGRSHVTGHQANLPAPFPGFLPTAVTNDDDLQFGDAAGTRGWPRRPGHHADRSSPDDRWARPVPAAGPGGPPGPVRQAAEAVGRRAHRDGAAGRSARSRRRGVPVRPQAAGRRRRVAQERSADDRGGQRHRGRARKLQGQDAPDEVALPGPVRCRAGGGGDRGRGDHRRCGGQRAGQPVAGCRHRRGAGPAGPGAGRRSAGAVHLGRERRPDPGHQREEPGAAGP